MYLKPIFFFVFFISAITIKAQIVNWDFTTGGNGNESPIVNMPYVYKDALGNIYQGGVFDSPTIDVDPSAVVVNLNNSGGNDGYFAKYSATGSLIWANRIGGINNDGINGLGTDASGNVYVTGYFNGTVDFDPSSGVYNLTAIGSPNSVTGTVFLAKYNSNGQFQWAFRFGSGTSYDYGWNVAVTPNGNVYVYGVLTMTFSSNVDIDPSAATFTLNPTGGDAYIAEYNTNGQLINGINFGGQYANSCVRDIKIDTDGKMYVGGYIKDNCDLDLGPGINNIISNSVDPFIMKLDTNFNFYWGFNIRTDNLTDEGFALSLDQHNVYFTGYVQGNNVDFDPGLGNTNLSVTGQSDIFIASYTKGGLYRWSHLLGGTGDDWGIGTACQGSSVLLSGFFHNTVDFDPSLITSQNITSNGGSDGFCLKLDTNGIYQCKFSVGGTGDDHIHSMWFYGVNQMLINGTFSNLSHIPEPTGNTIISNGGTDIFLADMYWNCQTCNIHYAIIDTIDGCKNFQFNTQNLGGNNAVQYSWNFGDGGSSNSPSPSHTYSSVGSYTLTLIVVDSFGCKDTVVKTININGFGYTIKDSIFACKMVTLSANHFSGKTASSFLWFFGDGQSGNSNPISHQYSLLGSYLVKLVLIDSVGCSDTISKNISFVDIHASFTVSDDTICQSQAESFTNSTLLSTFNHWSFGDGDTMNSTNANHIYFHSGVFNSYLIVRNVTGCVDTAFKVITVDSIANVDFQLSDSEICSGNPINVQAYILGFRYMSYEWSMGNGVLFGMINPINYTYTNSGIFPIKFTVHFRECPDEIITKNITVDELLTVNLGPDFSMCPNGVVLTLSDTLNAQNSLIQWQWNTNANTPAIQITSPGVYYVSASLGSCNSSDTIEVFSDCEIEIPNAFTPNGDDLNDYFMPVSLIAKGLKDFKMSIYNRWGELVFETSDTHSKGWNGRYHGEEQPLCVFFYMIKATLKSGKEELYKGDLTLIR